MSNEALSADLDRLVVRYRGAVRAGESPHKAYDGRSRGGRWKTWAAAASASFAAAGQAEAAVQYFAPSSPLRIEVMSAAPASDTAQLDLDADGLADFQFRLEAVNATSGGSSVSRTRALAFGLNPGASVVGGTNYAARLVSASSVSQLRGWEDEGLIHETVRSVTSSSSLTSQRGEWNANQSGFLGARFRITDSDESTSTHFGWIRVRTDFNGPLDNAFEIIDWAYELVPFRPIQAGDTVGQIDGDYNGDGEVNAEDLQEWTSTFGLDRIPGRGADGNSNGVVDAADYTIWRDAFGEQSASQAVSSPSVPEPAGIGLAVLAMGACGVRALHARNKKRK